jgi:NADPH-dependent curcumin reductase CurA
MLTSEYGFDAAVDYKASAGNGMALFTALNAACLGGIDVFFDNVGGEILEASLFAMKPFGRVVLCGADLSLRRRHAVRDPRPGWRGQQAAAAPRASSSRTSTMGDAREKAIAELRGWVAGGQIKVREDILDGLEKLPEALVGLLAGANVGKRMVKVA